VFYWLFLRISSADFFQLVRFSWVGTGVNQLLSVEQMVNQGRFTYI
jgi:hypothetical protein